RGRGAAAAAVRAIGSLAAKAGLSWLEARTSPENVASRRVLEACGFEQRGGVTEQETPSGEVAQVIEFEAPVSRFVRGQGGHVPRSPGLRLGPHPGCHRLRCWRGTNPRPEERRHRRRRRQEG